MIYVVYLNTDMLVIFSFFLAYVLRILFPWFKWEDIISDTGPSLQLANIFFK